ncbi:MAG: hypothetical protein ACUVSF_07560 [Anaerolineae bacterium]
MSVEDHVVDLGPEDVRPVSSPEPGSLPGKEEPATQPHTGPASPLDKDAARATFLGNTYDLAALGALSSGVLALLSCVTCNTIYYCVPLLPIALGVIGLVAAERSVNTHRTRTWSWIGIAAGIIILLVALAAVVLYIAFIALIFYMDYTGRPD